MYRIFNKKKLAATIAADAVGYVLFGLPRLLTRQRSIRHDNVKSILVIRTAYLGDVVMTLPMLKPLRERYPNARITFLTAAAAAGVLQNNPYVDETITYAPFWFYPSGRKEYHAFIRTMKARSFDLVIEARADIRDILLLARRIRAKQRVSYSVGGGGFLLTHVVPFLDVKHRVQYHIDIARYLGCADSELDGGIHLTESEKMVVQEIMSSNGIQEPFVAVHPGSRLPLKRWPAERYAVLCDWIQDQFDLPVVLFGSESEKELVRSVAANMRRAPVALAGALTIREFAGLISRAALFVCNDSAPMHIAAAMHTQTLAIFGPSKSPITGPYGKGHRVVEKDFPCRYSCDENSCSHARYNACIADITVNDVARAAADVFVRKGIAHVQV
jgi:lipopolysaccharide heptosyltransferase II